MPHLLNLLHDFLYLEEQEGQDFLLLQPLDLHEEQSPLLQHLHHSLDLYEDSEPLLLLLLHDDDKIDIEIIFDDLSTGYEVQEVALLMEQLQVMDLYRQVDETVLYDAEVVEWEGLSQVQLQAHYHSVVHDTVK